MSETTQTPAKRTKISPSQVYQLVALLPKELQERFRKEAYEDFVPKDVDFVPEPERRYNHSLGLSWLTKNNIPNTVEELEEQRQYVFQTMVSGPDTYNVGQFFVVFPSVIYHTRDIDDNLLIVEVMDELEFPPMPDLKVLYNDDIRQVPHQQQSTVALRYALQAYVASGKIKIHEAGYRMYSSTDMYTFQERFIDQEQVTMSFKEALKRRR